jgi:hypothetical protein
MGNKTKLATLAALGLVAGAMGTIEAANSSSISCVAPSSDQINKLFPQVDQAHQQTFNSLDCQTQNLALQLANQTCQGKNSCKGLNSCKTNNQNSCAGQGGCKGTSKGPFTDKNQAIDVAKKYMAEKRMNSMGQ